MIKIQRDINMSLIIIKKELRMEEFLIEMFCTCEIVRKCLKRRLETKELNFGLCDELAARKLTVRLINQAKNKAWFEKILPELREFWRKEGLL